MKGIVTKKIANLFLVGDTFCSARGNLKESGIFVGDKVEYDKSNKIIQKLLPRKNFLPRPPLANLDKMFIVIAPVPKPDFLLVDKMLLFCEKNGIKPVICVNKSDILQKHLKEAVNEAYSKVAPIIYVSAHDNNVQELVKNIKGVCAFAGQSAVGKSSLLNALHGEIKEQVGELAKKTERGKQTTRVVSLYKFAQGYIADTAGFSKLDEGLLDIDERELANYFVEFKPFLKSCEFLSCTHSKEKNCEIKKQVEEGGISQSRYQNYLKIFETLKDRRRKK